MATTVEERIREMGAARREITPAWEKAITKFKKDIAAPPFKKNGDVEALAHRFDVAQNKFEGTRNERDGADKFLEDGWDAYMKLGVKTGSLERELQQISADAFAATKSNRNPKDLEDRLNNWEEMFKRYRETSKEQKNIFDEINKVDNDRLKLLSDTSAKVRAAMKSGNSKLATFNAELNKLEEQIRVTVVKYQKTALDMNRSDIADAVRGFLKVFGN